jgi:hypothetical protein
MGYLSGGTTLLLILGLSAIPYPACAAEMSLTACPSDKTVIGGVNACGKIWKLGSGDAALSPDGKLVVDLHGLVLNDTSVGQYNGTPDGVDAVAVARSYVVALSAHKPSRWRSARPVMSI